MKYLLVREEGTVALADAWEPFEEAWEHGLITHIVSLETQLQYEGGGNWRDIEHASSGGREP